MFLIMLINGIYVLYLRYIYLIKGTSVYMYLLTSVQMYHVHLCTFRWTIWHVWYKLTLIPAGILIAGLRSSRTGIRFLTVFLFPVSATTSTFPSTVTVHNQGGHYRDDGNNSNQPHDARSSHVPQTDHGSCL